MRLINDALIMGRGRESDALVAAPIRPLGMATRIRLPTWLPRILAQDDDMCVDLTERFGNRKTCIAPRRPQKQTGVANPGNTNPIASQIVDPAALTAIDATHPLGQLQCVRFCRQPRRSNASNIFYATTLRSVLIILSE